MRLVQCRRSNLDWWQSYICHKAQLTRVEKHSVKHQACANNGFLLFVFHHGLTSKVARFTFHFFVSLVVNTRALPFMALLSFLLLLAAVKSTVGCSCEPFLPLKEDFDRTPTIFIGRVTATRVLPSDADMPLIEVSMEVEEPFKVSGG